jgi:hypothetical protein
MVRRKQLKEAFHLDEGPGKVRRPSTYLIAPPDFKKYLLVVKGTTPSQQNDDFVIAAMHDRVFSECRRRDKPRKSAASAYRRALDCH